MNLEKLTDEELDAWRVDPVSELMRSALWIMFEAQKKNALDSYWAGKPWPPEELAALRRMEAMYEDFFESSAEDLRTMMEQFDEHQRHKAD